MPETDPRHDLVSEARRAAVGLRAFGAAIGEDWEEIEGGVRIKSTPSDHVEIHAMLFNYRLALTPIGQEYYRRYWCYPHERVGALALAAICWDPDTELEPSGWIKSWDGRRHGEPPREKRMTMAIPNQMSTQDAKNAATALRWFAKTSLPSPSVELAAGMRSVAALLDHVAARAEETKTQGIMTLVPPRKDTQGSEQSHG